MTAYLSYKTASRYILEFACQKNALTSSKPPVAPVMFLGNFAMSLQVQVAFFKSITSDLRLYPEVTKSFEQKAELARPSRRSQ